jgi:guanylate kinase
MGKLVVISGVTGSGKSLLKRMILNSDSSFEGVQKLTTRSPRKDEIEGNNAQDEIFNCGEAEIANCECNYEAYGNKYGVKLSSVNNILSQGKNAIVVVGKGMAAWEMRIRCIEMGIDMYMISMQQNLTSKELSQLLVNRGRDQNELKGREAFVDRIRKAQPIETRFCDYILNNNYDTTNGNFEKSEEELLEEFNKSFASFIQKNDKTDKALQKLADKMNIDFKKLKTSYIDRLYLNHEDTPVYQLSEQFIDFDQSEEDIRGNVELLKKESELQKWLDSVLMNNARNEVMKTMVIASKGKFDRYPDELEKLYKDEWEQVISNSENEEYYMELVNKIPLRENETAKDRLSFLRQFHNDNDLQAKLIKIGRLYGEYEI